jgi:hypothetical protein
MLIDIIKHADPSKLERAMEIEEELHQIFTDKRHLGMLANDEVLVESDW